LGNQLDALLKEAKTPSAVVINAATRGKLSEEAKDALQQQATNKAN